MGPGGSDIRRPPALYVFLAAVVFAVALAVATRNPIALLLFVGAAALVLWFGVTGHGGDGGGNGWDDGCDGGGDGGGGGGGDGGE